MIDFTLDKVKKNIDDPYVKHWLNINIGTNENDSAEKIYDRLITEGKVNDYLSMIDSNQDMPLPAKLMVSSINSNKVFKNYDPTLLRFPMQLVLHSDDIKLLSIAIKQFCDNYKTYKAIIVDGYGYIEYVPDNHSKYTIPDDNWEINKIKDKNIIRRS